jgi:putative ABC transport system permease protein
MPLWSFLVFRNWASSRLRTALSLLGIALGTAIVVAIHVMDHNTVQSRLVDHDPDSGPVDLEVTPLSNRALDAETVRRDLASRAGIAAVAVWRQAKAVCRRGERTLDVAVFGLQPLPAGPFAHYAVVAGRDLAPGDGGAAVLLGVEAGKLLDVAVGDDLTLSEPPAGQRVECKDGVLHVQPVAADHQPYRTSVKVAGLIAYERLGRRNFGEVIVCSHDLASRLAVVGDDLFQVQRVAGADLDSVRAGLGGDYRVANKRAAMIGEGADERAFRNGTKILGCLALIVGMFVVFQTLSHSLVARVRQIGLLRCLGVSAGGLFRIFLADALLLGVIGSALGVGLGIALARLLRAFDISSLGTGKVWHTFELPVAPLLWTGTLGVVFTLAGALFPLLRVRSVSALQVLNGRGLSPQHGGHQDLLRGFNLWLFGLLVVLLPVAYLAMTPLASQEGYETLVVLAELVGMLVGFGGVLLLAPVLVALAGRALLWPVRWLLPLAGFLVDKVLQRDRARIAASTCGLAAVLVALLGLKTLTASLQAEVYDFAGAALDDRLFVEGTAVTAAKAQALASLPGVFAVEPQEGLQQDGFLLGGLDIAAAAGRDGALEPFPELAARYADGKRRCLIASTRLARKMDWRAGTLVPLRDRNGEPVTYEVLLVSDRSGFQPSERGFAVAAPHWLQHDFCVPAACVERITVRLRPGADADAVGERCRQLLPGTQKLRSGAFIRGYLARDVVRDFRLFDLLVLLILLLAVTSLLNGMTIASLGRSRETGVLRALGVGKATVRGSSLIEGAIAGALSAALALLLAVPMARVLISGLNRVAGLDAPLTLPWDWFAATPAIAVGTGLLAAILPGMRAAALNPAASVRYE